MPTKTAGGGFGEMPPVTVENAEAMGVKDEFEAGTKLKLFLDELSGYLNYTVFDGSQTVPGVGAVSASPVTPGVFGQPAPGGDHE